MISGEGIKCGQLIPPCTELLSSVSSKATNVGSNHLDSKQLAVEVVSNGPFKERPGCIVVSCPMESIFLGAKSRASGDNEGPDILALQKSMSRLGLKESTVGMNIGFALISIVG